MPIILWDTQIIKQEGEHVKAFWKVGEEVKDSPILLDVGLGIGFKSMDHIWKIHPIVNKEDRKVVSSKVKVTLCSEGKDKNHVYCILQDSNCPKSPPFKTIIANISPNKL
jgi:hypothetical protein